jgi:hypothetical protein
VFELREAMEAVIAQRLLPYIQLRWMEAVMRFLEKSAQKYVVLLFK